MQRILLIPIAIFLLSSAAPPASPEEQVRRGNAAFRVGDPGAAERLYATAAEKTADPGLVAFNTAAALVEQGEYREAELSYLRSLDDRAAPPERRAKALYNRGVCLVKRPDLPALRTAVSCFEQALDSDALEESLRVDARYNLELAKLLWAEARAKQGSKETPNHLPPEEDQDLPPPAGGNDPGVSQPGGAATQAGPPQPAANGVPGGAIPQPTEKSTAGAGTLPVLAEGPNSQRLSADDAREHLRRVAERLDRDRRANARLLAGPERPHVRDW